jgi:hypothetical protein
MLAERRDLLMRKNLKGATCLHLAAAEGHVTVTEVSVCMHVHGLHVPKGPSYVQLRQKCDCRDCRDSRVPL